MLQRIDRPSTLKAPTGVILGTTRVLRTAANALEGFEARRRFRGAPTAPAEAYEFVASFQYGDVRPAPIQIREEIIGLLGRLSEQPPRSVVELGTARGGTLFLLTRVAAGDATLVSVDVRGGPFGGGYPRTLSPLLNHSRASGRQSTSFAATPILQPRSIVFGKPSAFRRLICSSSTPITPTRASVLTTRCTPPSSGAALSRSTTSSKGPPERVGGVPRFWKEIRTEGSEEIVADWGQGGYGIGLMRQP